MDVKPTATVKSLTEDGVYQNAATTLNFVTTNFYSGVGLEIFIKITPSSIACGTTGGVGDAIDNGANSLTYSSITAGKMDITTSLSPDDGNKVCYKLGGVNTGTYAALADVADTLHVKAAATVKSLTEDGVYTGSHVTTLNLVTTLYEAGAGLEISIKVIANGASCTTGTGTTGAIAGTATVGTITRVNADSAKYDFSTSLAAADNQVVCYAIGTVGTNAAGAATGSFVQLADGARAFDVKAAPTVV
jgi:hypothetical protein